LFTRFLAELLEIWPKEEGVSLEVELQTNRSFWSNGVGALLDKIQSSKYTMLQQYFLPNLTHIPKCDDSVLLADSLVQSMEAPDANESVLFEEYSIFNSEGGAVWFSGRLFVNHTSQEILLPIYKYLLFMNYLEAPYRKSCIFL
jgi:hypothetical protein